MKELISMYEDEIYLISVCLAALFLAVLFMLFSFFTVTVKSALEESDDVYDFFSIGWLKFTEGKWQIDLKTVFDENSTVKLHFGWMFILLFSGWEVEGIASGDKKGIVREKAEQDMKMQKRRIRRS